jgi:CRP-like cAMP-binding protein
MITLEKVLFLRNVPLFGGMDSRDLAVVSEIAEEVVFSAGSCVIEEGEYGESMFVIVRGSVRLHRGDVTLQTLEPPTYFGELSILDGEPRVASATAVTDCLLLEIARDKFHGILRQHSQASLEVIRCLVRYLRSAWTPAAAPVADRQAG